MKKFVIGVLLTLTSVLLLSSCSNESAETSSALVKDIVFEKAETILNKTQQEIGTIISAEISMKGNYILNISAQSNGFKHYFDVQFDSESNRLLLAPNKKMIGIHTCLEQRDDQCLQREYDLDFINNNVHFSAKINVEHKSSTLLIHYFETKKYGDIMLRNYSEADHFKITVNSNVNHSIVFKKYKHEKKVAPALYIKKIEFEDNQSLSLNIIGKIPRYSTSDSIIFSGFGRSGYKIRQNQKMKIINIYKNNVIFNGTETGLDFFSFFERRSRNVGLLIKNLDNILEI